MRETAASRPCCPPRVASMSERLDLPILGQEIRERSDAAGNREALLGAAARLVERCGVEAVTMDAVAEAALVGKGTVFRRFGSRAGLMAKRRKTVPLPTR